MRMLLMEDEVLAPFICAYSSDYWNSDEPCEAVEEVPSKVVVSPTESNVPPPSRFVRKRTVEKSKKRRRVAVGFY